jgi:cell wall-associated NlpC family hydrolase
MYQGHKELIGAVALAMLATGCASTGAVPRPFPTTTSRPHAEPAVDPDGTSGVASSLPVDSYALVGTALDLRGVRYRNGGSDPRGFDCSGFTQYVFAQHGVTLPRSVRDQFDQGRPVRPGDVREGDLLFFETEGAGASHVAIAVGGARFVHAPSTSGVVRVEDAGTRYWSDRFVGARRVP